MGLTDQMIRMAGAVGPLSFARECLGLFPDAAQAAVMERAPEFREIVGNNSQSTGL